MIHLALFRWDTLWWPESGHGYAFWSSFGSCLMYASIFVLVYRKLNCHVTGCHRLGLHHVRGTPYITCRKHHPDEALTAEHVALRHAEANTKPF